MPKSKSKSNDLESKTVAELKALCKKQGIPKCYSLKKAGLVKVLSGVRVPDTLSTKTPTTKSKLLKSKRPREIISLIKKIEFDEKPSVDLSSYPNLFPHKKSLFFNKTVLNRIKHSDGALSFVQYKEPTMTKFLGQSGQHQTSVVAVPNEPYDYFDASIPENSGIYTCYVNFADSELFGYWFQPHFAQDEIQVAEHPDLARVAVELNYPNCWEKPCLISNAQRTCKIVNLSGIYGWKFMSSALAEARKHVVQVKPTTKTNILAMAAIHVDKRLAGRKYSRDDIIILFKTAYTAFRMVVVEKKVKNNFEKVIINTGNWGTGAFGNDHKLVAVLQILAARLADVDGLRYFTYSDHGSKQFNNAVRWIEKNVYGGETVDELIDLLDKEKSFVYGLANGT
jgi:hypothetical protein